MRTLTLALLAALPGLSLTACSRHSTHALPPEEARALLIDRSWVDRLPTKIDDKLHVFRFTPSMGGGVYQDRTIFAGTFELFGFEHDGQRIRFNLLHTGDKKICPYVIEPLADKGPEGVDLKLTIEGSPRGASVYYSWRKNPADLDATLAHAAAGR
jgi:hypothetical protein